MRQTVLFLTILALATLATSVQANQLRFLADTAIAELTKEEFESFKQFINKELDTLPDKKSALWESTASGVKGKVKSELTYTQNDRECRRTRLALQSSKGENLFLKFDLCKNEGVWQIVESPLANVTKEEWQVVQDELQMILNEGADGHPVNWDIQSVGVLGTITPLNSATENGKTCRQVAISAADNKGYRSGGRYEFCLIDQQWIRTIE